jgi:hypothetical protein
MLTVLRKGKTMSNNLSKVSVSIAASAIGGSALGVIRLLAEILAEASAVSEFAATAGSVSARILFAGRLKEFLPIVGIPLISLIITILIFYYLSKKKKHSTSYEGVHEKSPSK